MEADGKCTRRVRPWWLLAPGLLLALTATLSVASGEPRTLRIGGDANYPPYHFLDARGHPDGFDIELSREIAADLGLEPVFELGDWGAALERLARGELDVVPMFWSPARELRYGLTEPFLIRHHALFGHYETPAVSSLEALANVRIAVQSSGLAWEAMRELDRPGVTLVETNNESETLRLVAQGAVDYALAPTGIGYYAIQHEDLPGIVALTPPLLERKYVFAVRPGDPELVAAINGSLGRLRRNGVQNRLYVEWIGNPGAPGEPLPTPRNLFALLLSGLGALAVACIALLALLAWQRRRRPATAHTVAPSQTSTAAASTQSPDATVDSPRLLEELSEAIANQQLAYALQPKIDLRSGRLLGAELLVRWDHPRLGPMAPEEFVPIAEQARTIGEMTLYLVRHGLAQCRGWPTTGDPLHVSINVSANDLADPHLVDAIIDACDGGCPGLMLEITETEVMREPERVAEALPRLRSHGIGISVDDFGVGHSSLVNLRRLAPDELKIDRSFVRALLASHSDRAIVRATIDLGHELGASVAAEGIEDEDTRAWLTEAGCDAGQGFWIARPMPPAEFVQLLQAQR
ncbi:EAL domain-containing protein [Luteimonas sp. A534]